MKPSIRTICHIFIFSIVAFLSSCHHDIIIHPGLSEEKRQEYGRAIEGEYEGKYRIFYTNEETHQHDRTEDGTTHFYSEDVIIENAQITATNYKQKTIFLHDFPVSLIAEIISTDTEQQVALKEALKTAPNMDIECDYTFGFDTDRQHIVWTPTPRPISLTLTYGGQTHHVRIDPSQHTKMRYIINPEKLTGTTHALCNVINEIDFETAAIYVDNVLAQSFNFVMDKGMLIEFRMKK